MNKALVGFTVLAAFALGQDTDFAAEGLKAAALKTKAVRRVREAESGEQKPPTGAPVILQQVVRETANFKLDHAGCALVKSTITASGLACRT